MNKTSPIRFLRRRVITKRTLLVVGIILILALPAIVYQFDIDWAEEIRRYGYPGIFFLSLVCSMTILFPLPGEAVLAAAPGIMKLAGAEVFWLGVVASTGGALGETTAYFAGLWGRVVIADKYQKDYGRVDRWMGRYGGPAIFVFALTPLPFDLVGIAAGSLRFPLWQFLLFCWAGRLIRALIVVYFGWGSVKVFFS